MTDLNLFLILIGLTVTSFLLCKNRAKNWQLSIFNTELHSLPTYYGYLSALWVGLPALLILFIWSFVEVNTISMLVVAEFEKLQNIDKSSLSLALNEIKNLSNTLIKPNIDNILNNKAAIVYSQYMQNNFYLKFITTIGIALLSFVIVYTRITPVTKARNGVEKIVTYILFFCALIAILTTTGIIFSVLFESIEFFSQVSIFDFLFGTHWSPQNEDIKDAFGVVPLFWGTIFISLVAILIAGPLGLISAIYLAEYASKKVRSIVKPVLEILAGVPTVVYGFFAALTVGPLVRDFGNFIRDFGINLDIELMANITVSTESVLATGLVMGMMIVPFILSLSDDVISAVPDAMRDGSTAMGATKSETVWKVIIPAALPGIVGGFLLAISRAIGETMIVLMAAGVAANLTANPLDSVTTVTTQIVVLLTGDQEFDSVKTLAAFALGLGLFIITLILNIIALYVVRKYREQYD